MRWATLLVAFATGASAQELGHKILGSLGIDAGTQQDSGLYLATRVQQYQANRLLDRNGQLVPIPNLDVGALGAGVGVGVTFKARHLPYLSLSFAIPIAHLTLSSDNPLINVDAFGLGDVFVEPLRMGWRLPHVDLIAAWAFYAPTGLFEPQGGGVGRGQWTQELSWGAALFLDGKRRYRMSALASWDKNGPKQNLDVTRGDTLQIQGGLGAKFFKVLDVGLAGYALWQLSDDRGADLPAVLRGARDRVFGLGPEVGMTVVPIRVRLTARYEWDLAALSRPEGRVFSFGISFLAWR